MLIRLFTSKLYMLFNIINRYILLSVHKCSFWECIIVDNYNKPSKLLSTTRWVCQSKTVNGIKNNFSTLLITTKQITDNTK